MHIKRHDRIVNHIHSQLITSHPQFTVYVNRLITGNMLNANLTELYMLMLFTENRTYSFEDQLKKAYMLKFLRHTMLLLTNVIRPNSCITVLCVNSSISTRRTHAKLSSLFIIGSTGCVHKNVVPGLKTLWCDTRRSKAIAKYLSISAAIGSKIVWQMRVSAVSAQR